MAYLGKLRKSLNKIKRSNHSDVWLGGDFNLGDIDWPTQSTKSGCPKVALSRELIDLVNDFGLEQLVDKPTRKNRILDLFLTSNPTLVSKAVNVPGLSDHDGIPSITVDTVVKKSKQCPRKVYLYHKADSEGLKMDEGKISEDFERKNLDGTDINSLWSEFKERVNNSVESNVPSKVIRKRNISPWISPKMKCHQRRKQRAYNRAIKYNRQSNWERFYEIRKAVKKETRAAYRRYVHDKCLGSTKQLFSFIKSLQNDNTGIPALKDQTTGILVTNSIEKAEVLSRHFQSQFTKEDMDNLPVESDSDIPSMPDIVFNKEGVVKLLSELNTNKAMGPDEISPRYLKMVAEEIGQALQIIFQYSYNTGTVPIDWLISNITPLFKKGDRTNPGNYRSVNLTSVCSILFEHILKSNIMHHLDRYDILCENQHGFRKNHSCETQLINTIQDIALLLDQKHQVDIIIMDFAKALTRYHTIDYSSKCSVMGSEGKCSNGLSHF